MSSSAIPKDDIEHVQRGWGYLLDPFRIGKSSIEGRLIEEDRPDGVGLIYFYETFFPLKDLTSILSSRAPKKGSTQDEGKTNVEGSCRPNGFLSDTHSHLSLGTDYTAVSFSQCRALALLPLCLRSAIAWGCSISIACPSVNSPFPRGMLSSTGSSVDSFWARVSSAFPRGSFTRTLRAPWSRLLSTLHGRGGRSPFSRRES